MTSIREKRFLEGAANYAAADKSDPFAYARALAHLRSGICGVDANGRDATYAAERCSEERTTPDGQRFTATVYRNITRP